MKYCIHGRSENQKCAKCPKGEMESGDSEAYRRGRREAFEEAAPSKEVLDAYRSYTDDGNRACWVQDRLSAYAAFIIRMILAKEAKP